MCQLVPRQRQPSSPTLSYCIYVHVLSPPLNIAYSRAIITHLTVTLLWTLIHTFIHFSANYCPIHLISFLTTLHQSIHTSILPLLSLLLQFYLPSSMFPSLLPFLHPTLYLPSPYLVLSPFPPSLCPGTVYNLPLFFSSFLPLPSFFHPSLSFSFFLSRSCQF